MTLKSIWRRESAKRSRFAKERERCDRNWPFHKERARAVFEELTSLSDDFLIIDHEQQMNDQRDSFPAHWGQDSIAIYEIARLTGQRTVYTNGTSVHIDHMRESGGGLVIHYGYETALIQIFLAPPKTSKSLIKKNDVLIFSGFNTDVLTSDFIRTLVAKYLIFIRVESVLHRSTFLESYRVRFWRFIDARNTRQIFDKPYIFLNQWELSLAVGLLAVISLVVSILKP
ncbi:hypothetical protein [Pseudomonas vancouverensis]|uniref:Uncharacterized protein n=1 Tax=Pseudomonas vancouverensis TaxID=95300 RepID=A0A1H2MWR7_PSEVA|nr:hypothetical protein [Pseudomonas vancouverensis]KAB0489654.1 hypothetical protein F7R09_28445 [Pseudomonas vancouverensis]TDB69300.1 hypothetical protein EIY72_00150 [Pseudomonas vancouverensis]SDU97381.1 hypothetical protein SAMN05216558_1353 [Pseudomonas vancouverensis]